MCDPLTLGALAVGAAGTAANSMGQAKAQKKQEAEYNQWAENQKQIRAQENQRQEELRGKAETSRQQGVEDISAENQKALQDAEQARLAALYSGETLQPAADPAAPESVADAALTGQQSGGEVFQTELARKLSDATASAKQRIGALATVNSYGNSYGGLGTVNPLAQQQAGSGIDAANAARKGSLAAYGVERDVDPTEISYSNPIADIASSFLGVGMNQLGAAMAPGGGGTGLSNIFASKVKPPDPWAGVRVGANTTGLF